MLAVVLAFPDSLFAQAQTDTVTTSPPNIVVPNYNGVPVGPFGGLEASAYVARAGDPTAAWFNPAGLSRAEGAQVTGSAGLYQLTTVSPQSASNPGGSVQQVPNVVGFTIKTKKLTLGAAFVTTVSWQQETDTQRITTTGNPERFAYSGDSSFTQRVAAFSAAYNSGQKWRIGGGLAFSYTSLRMVQTASDRVAEPTDLRTLLVSSRLNGSTFQLQPVLGVQFDPNSKIRIGAIMRTSGFSIYKSGSVTLDGTQDTGAASVGASFFDPSANFEYKLPFQASGAIAFIGSRAQVEIDVQGYSSIAAYKMFSSGQNFAIYSDAGNGTPPTVQTAPSSGITSASRAMANVSVGGFFQLKKDSPLLLHWGIASDISPVAPEDQIFDRVDFYAWTVGMSGRVGKLYYAAGVNYRGGNSSDIIVRNVLGGTPIQTSVDIKTIGMIYSLAYQF